MKGIITGLVLLAAGIALAIQSPSLGAEEAQTERTHQALAAEDAFFKVFNEDPRRREAPLRDLMIAWLSDRSDGRTQLLLGLNHLWLAAEGDRTNPRVLEHLLLAERFLLRAEELMPHDRRIPSWSIPARLYQAADGAERDAMVEELMTAYRKDPNFHSFSVALLGFPEPAGSPAFERGLAALRSTEGGCEGDPEDASCLNQPRWPHNVEGFVTFFADYELKAGHSDRAQELLQSVRREESFVRWPFRGEVEDRIENLELYADLYGNDDPGDDPPSLFSGGSRIGCQACHLAGEE